MVDAPLNIGGFIMRYSYKTSGTCSKQIDFDINGDDLVITYTGNGFLQNMVRIMTGTLIEVGSKQKKPDDINNIIEGRKRELAGYTAPPQGLTLEKVIYENN